MMKEKRSGIDNTLFVAGGEDDRSGVVTDEALGDPGMAEVGGDSAALLDHRVGVNHLDDERVTAGPRLQLVYLGEHRLPLRPLPLLLPRSRH